MKTLIALLLVGMLTLLALAVGKKEKQFISEARETKEDVKEENIVPVHLKIAEAMKARGLSQRKMAEMVGYSRSHIRSVIKGQRKLSDTAKARFAEALKIEL